MNEVIYWATPVYGRVHGTIECSDGHVLLRDIPDDQRDRYESMIGDLPAKRSVEQAARFLEERGFPRAHYNDVLTEFGPLPSAEPSPDQGPAEAEPEDPA